MCINSLISLLRKQKDVNNTEENERQKPERLENNTTGNPVKKY